MGAKVTGDTGSFVAAMSKGTRALGAFTGGAGLAAGALGAFAGAAIMGAAIKAAVEFEAELTKLNTLVGIQTEQIEKWSKSIKALALETGKAPADLARAMFAISSGGARGTEALDLLTSAAKASAIGLGDMTDIGRFATAALQAFGSTGLTAEKAIDVLTATVRAGNLEASELASSFGKVMGTAASLGLGLEDLGAFVATYTRLGVDARIATTGLNAALNLILKPQDVARQKMEELGVPVEMLRKMLAEQGLNAALVALKTAIGDDIDALGKVIPNIRAMSGVLGTVGVQSEAYLQIQNDINDSLGLTAEGFETWSDTSQATFARFKQSITVAGIALGEVFLPPLGLLVKMITPLLVGFGKLVDVTDDFFRALVQGKVSAFLQELSGSDIIRPRPQFMIDDFTNSIKDMDISGLREKEREIVGILERMLKSADGMSKTQLRVTGLGASINQYNEEIQELQLKLKGLMDQQVATTSSTKTLTVQTEEQMEAIAGILDGLETEILLLTKGARHVMLKTLADEGATLAQLILAAVRWGNIESLEAEARATKDATRESDRLAKAAEREAKRLKDRRAKAFKDAKDAAQRLIDDRNLAIVQDEIREITRISVDMAEAIGSAFDDIISGTENVATAFGNMVTEILRQVQRLLIQRAIVEPLVNFALGRFAPSLPAAVGVPQTNVPGFGFKGLSTIAVGGTSNAVAAPSQTQTIVQQTINFSPQLIDQRSGQRFIEEQGPAIAKVISDAVEQSGAFASRLR